MIHIPIPVILFVYTLCLCGLSSEKSVDVGGCGNIILVVPRIAFVALIALVALEPPPENDSGGLAWFGGTVDIQSRLCHGHFHREILFGCHNVSIEYSLLTVRVPTLGKWRFLRRSPACGLACKERHEGWSPP